MFITDCLAYTHISAELGQQDELFTVTVKTQKNTDISLVFNYLQIKVLEEGLLTLIGQTKFNEVTEVSITKEIGDITLCFYLPSLDEADCTEKGETLLCRPQLLSAPMELKSRFKTA